MSILRLLHHGRHRPCPTRARGGRGFSLIEVLVAMSILSLGLLAHASNAFSGQRLVKAEAQRGVAIQTLRRFVERMRSDVAFTSLYARCRALYDTSSESDPPVHLPSQYYADFTTPESLGDVRILVEIPRSQKSGSLTEQLVLREDVDLPAYGLPYDLDGDGTITSDQKDDAYLALPVRIHFAWSGNGDAPQRIRLNSWLTGER